jgi:hypothetical protein
MVVEEDVLAWAKQTMSPDGRVRVFSEEEKAKYGMT